MKLIRNLWVSLFILGGLVLQGQIPPQAEVLMMNPQGGAQVQVAPQDPVGAPQGVLKKTPTDALQVLDPLTQARIERQKEIASARKKDQAGKPARFAQDLFDVQELMTAPTEGGISDDYVLGVGDQLLLNVFGSATFEVPIQVDGKGELSIPKIGVLKVTGLSLQETKKRVERLINSQFSRASISLQIVKLREIRIMILGDVYRPGTYLVPSLSSIVNVLSLSGGPTTAGSYRDVRIVRNGTIIHRIDLYPLRADGTGNANVALQSGDTVFVPLASFPILLKGSFRRVEASANLSLVAGTLNNNDDRARVREDIESQISVEKAKLLNLKTLEEDKPVINKKILDLTRSMDALRQEVVDVRRSINPATGKYDDGSDNNSVKRDAWLQEYERFGLLPSLLFEVKEGELISDMIRWSGGVDVANGSGVITHQYRDVSGNWDARTLSINSGSSTLIAPGDTLTALPLSTRNTKGIEVIGSVRLTGPFELTPNLRVGDLIKKYDLIIPQTYLPRAEIIHTDIYGKKTIEVFDVTKAVSRDPAHNLNLLPQDTIRFVSRQSMTYVYSVKLNGSIPRAGEYEFIPGMRVADLIFRGGLINPEKSNLYQAELARIKDPATREATIISLDLARLLSNEGSSPVELKDDQINPLLEPNDVVSLFFNPNAPQASLQKSVKIRGQVQRPGDYVLDSSTKTLAQLIQRAGGFTDRAMPKAGIFIRGIQIISQLSELTDASSDPTRNGVPDILRRLSETKRDDKTGVLQTNPVRFGLTGASSRRLVVDFEQSVKGEKDAQVDLQDGDEVIVPEQTSSAYVVGEVASPFTVYNLGASGQTLTVSQAIARAGGFTRNASTSQVRLLKANGQIIDSSLGITLWTYFTKVEAGDTVLIPQKFVRDTSWQEDLAAITPIALILNAIKTP